MSRIKSFLSGIILLMTVSSASAQIHWVDSVRYSLQQKPRFYVNVTTFSSFISQEVARFSGGRVGLQYNKRIRFGLGYFALNSEVTNSIDVPQGTSSYVQTGTLHYHYFTLSAEWIFNKDYPWQVSVIPFEWGMGPAYFNYLSIPAHEHSRTATAFVMTYEPEVNAVFNINRWAGLGATVGYRFSVNHPRNITENFNSPLFTISAKLFMDELYRMFFPDGIAALKKKPSSVK